MLYLAPIISNRFVPNGHLLYYIFFVGLLAPENLVSISHFICIAMISPNNERPRPP